jgi:hypothetical protein
MGEVSSEELQMRSEPQLVKEQATQIHAGKVDSSLNGIISNTYGNVIVRSEPNKRSAEIARIPIGAFFKITGKSGKFTQIEYNGTRGYALSTAVKKLSKNRAAEMRFDAYGKDKPEKDAKDLRYLMKGVYVALLGENVDGFAKIEYYGEVYWVEASRLCKW